MITVNEQVATMVTSLLRSSMDTINTSINQVTLTQSTSNEAFRTQAEDAQRILGEVQVWLADFIQRIDETL